jgi:ATP-binding protein involved in chromosome partitioning
VTECSVLLRKCVRDFVDPEIHKPLKQLNVRVSLQDHEGVAILQLERPYGVSDEAAWQAALKQHIEVSGVSAPGSLQLKILNTVVACQPMEAPKHPKIANVVAILSGKGGVGKSTVTANLAVALTRQGWRVGLLDADIHGPSQILMMGVSMDEASDENQPVMAHGVQVMSMGMYLKVGQPAAWRGPMASKAFQQLFTQTIWMDLDFLLVDCPPGTSDIMLTLARTLPVVGGVLVTTPQVASIMDAERAGQLMKNLAMPLLGVVENMSGHACPACGHDTAILGTGGGAVLADCLETVCWAQLPLQSSVSDGGDQGQPIALQDSVYDIVADRLTQAVAQLPKYNPLSSVSVESVGERIGDSGQL